NKGFTPEITGSLGHVFPWQVGCLSAGHVLPPPPPAEALLPPLPTVAAPPLELVLLGAPPLPTVAAPPLELVLLGAPPLPTLVGPAPPADVTGPAPPVLVVLAIVELLATDVVPPPPLGGSGSETLIPSTESQPNAARQEKPRDAKRAKGRIRIRH